MSKDATAVLLQKNIGTKFTGSRGCYLATEWESKDLIVNWQEVQSIAPLTFEMSAEYSAENKSRITFNNAAKGEVSSNTVQEIAESLESAGVRIVRVGNTIKPA